MRTPAKNGAVTRRRKGTQRPATRQQLRLPPKRMASDDGPACIVCGCVQDNACEGSCEWVSVRPPVCSRCGGQEDPFRVEALGEPVVIAGDVNQPAGHALGAWADDAAVRLCEALNLAFKMGGVSAVGLRVPLSKTIDALRAAARRRAHR